MAKNSNLDEASLDNYFVYRCDINVGVPTPWCGGHLRIHDRYKVDWHFHHAVDINRIGLVLACSDHDIYRRLLTDARLSLVIDQKPFWDSPFSAFADAAMAKSEAVRLDDVAGKYKNLMILSQSLPADPVLDIPAKIPWRMNVCLDKDLSNDLKLQEREIFSAIATRREYKPDWFIRIGARAIGKQFRERL